MQNRMIYIGVICIIIMGIRYNGVIRMFTKTDPSNPNNCTGCHQTKYECRCLGYKKDLKLPVKLKGYNYLNDLQV